MATNPVLVGGLLLVGGAAAYALYKAWQAQNQTATQNYCNGLCGTDATCLAACNAAGSLLGGIGSALNQANPFTNSTQDYQNGLNGDIANNNSLNGAIAIPNTVGGDTILNPLQGPALQYANGCQPFFNAPAWGKCAPGTVDMYSDAVISRHGSGSDDDAEAGTSGKVTQNLTVAPLGAGAGYNDYTNGNNANTPHGNLVLVPIVNENFMTGAIGDPTTFGPWGPTASPWNMIENQTDDQNRGGQPWGGEPTYSQTAAESAIGPFTWMTRGQRTTCPSGQAPKTVLLGSNGVANPDPIGTETCVSIQGGSDLCVGGQPPPGLTWDSTTGVWVKAKAGQAINPGPCATGTVGCVGPACNTIIGRGGSGTFSNGSSSAGTSGLGAYGASGQSKAVAGAASTLMVNNISAGLVKSKLGSLA